MSSTQASVIIVNKDGREYLEDCLSTVTDQKMGRDDYEIILVDNDSSDGSVEFVREEYPDVRVVANEKNRWYAGGNNDGFEAANGEVLVVLNPDVAVEPDWLETLIDPLLADESIGITTSKIVRYDDRSRLNTCGNHLHYTGLGTCRLRDEHPEACTERESVPAASGCSFAIRAETVNEIGGLDEAMEFYFEDHDISWRTHIAGYDVQVVPDSIVYHKYERTLPAWRFFMMERNRTLIPLKHLRFRTLLLILPALVMAELLMILYAAVRGPEYLSKKVEAWMWLVRNRDVVSEKRDHVHSIRRVTDAELFRNLDFRFPVSQFSVPSLLATPTSILLAVAFLLPYTAVTKGVFGNE